jgi:hypothetical protein
VSDDTDDAPTPPATASKVGRVIETYDIAGLGETLEARWTGTGGERSSLRDLADLVNRRLLAAAMSDADMRVLDGEVENTYRLLTADDASSGGRAEAEARLRQAGVDVETLRADFVSHQAVHTYLTRYRGASLPRDDGPTPERDAATVGRLRSRIVTVTESLLERRRAAGDHNHGDAEVLVDVTVVCRDCGVQRDPAALLRAGGCDCAD